MMAKMEINILGGKSSPSCNSYSVNQFNAETVKSFQKNVDDILNPNIRKKKPKKFLHIAELLDDNEKRGFRLTKWLCNSKFVLQSIKKTEKKKDLATG